ncbi:DUF4282 domain-containing protein [Arenicella xantha]|uniref:Uncharacterized protein DUF4282 n=1 Tax=Arenicella xantha TaxID=644221 RepID=A0A395JIR1_9GAMM|nr:DUF4282 domain-containing protein [Arenicella xantha]RBP49659.1 uncharacterized protein DUF4282 [Arenicella xantha]
MFDKLDDVAAEPTVRKVLFFDNMLTPKLIQVAYWLGLVAIIWNGLGRLFSGGFFGIFETAVFVLISVIVLRVSAELVMLLFKLYDTMQAIENNTQAPVSEPDAPVKTVRKTKKKMSKKVSKKPS